MTKLIGTIAAIMKEMIIHLPCPKSINFFWNLGSFLGILLFSQIFSGILLTFFFSNEASVSFFSIENLSRLTENGFLIRWFHMNMASFFFFCMYLHMFRGLYFFSYRNQNSWNSGMSILILLMATAFLGYVLPWGQMSFWAATVITKFFSVIPFFGVKITQIIWSGFAVNNLTLKFFFSLHFFLPFVMLGMVFLHLLAIHFNGSSNPSFLTFSVSKMPFSPFFIMKDSLNIWILAIIMFSINMWVSSESVNFIPADFSSSPAHIKPEWYFLFAYAILRSVPNKLLGVILMFLSLLVFYLLPVQKSKLMLSSFKFINKFWFFFFFSNFVILSWIGGNPVTDLFVLVGSLSSFLYFFVFFILMFEVKLCSFFF